MKFAAIAALAVALFAGPAFAQQAPQIDPKASVPLAPVDFASLKPGDCHLRYAANGMSLPDPHCTPGAINPTITADVLKNPAFRTGQERDLLTSAAQKRRVYALYGITPPANNRGPNQTCELDHLISIGLGGSDALENVWPECGPSNVPVGQREFKIKDAHAELSLMRQVKAGADLRTIQMQIAKDWTQFIVEPTAKHPRG